MNQREGRTLLSDSTIARSLPDVDRIAFFLHQATHRPLRESQQEVFSLYSADVLIEQMLIAARPTVTFLRNLGVKKSFSFEEALSLERERLTTEMTSRLSAMGD